MGKGKKIDGSFSYYYELFFLKKFLIFHCPLSYSPIAISLDLWAKIKIKLNPLKSNFYPFTLNKSKKSIVGANGHSPLHPQGQYFYINFLKR
jgi:hypothetical protein